MKAADVVDQLGYNSGNWLTPERSEPAPPHLWHLSQQDYVLGSYVFKTSPNTDSILPVRPAVHVATAVDERDARKIHREMWNLSTAPFLLLILPNQVRVYSGFKFDSTAPSECIVTANLTAADISRKLHEFYASEIDSGRIWRTQAQNLSPERRVDQCLLRNLKQLGDHLVDTEGLDTSVAHALIGKYIYIKYLVDRGILSRRWLRDHRISLDEVLGRDASLKGLRLLIEALEHRFNGRIFPLDFDESSVPDDAAVAYVASVFRGDDAISGQLALDFQAYDFSFIPVETLSSIYEQFLRREGKGKEKGAVYTREFLADYVLCELNSVKPLQRGMKVLDAACGSGVFLVLAYRRLIELELGKRRRRFLPPERLGQILKDSIFGVEVILDACYVTEFSLILTLLSYVDPPDLDKNESFQFPDLHNKNIFNCDFFDDSSIFWKRQQKFNWIVGNPSWSKLHAETAADEQPNAWNWIKKNEELKPIGKYSLSEAFSWRVTDVLAEQGHSGLLLHGTSLFNRSSVAYRREFFKQHEVSRITNFANLAYILFKGRSDAPAASVIYSKTRSNREKPPIIHYGPFVANQIFFRQNGQDDVKKQAWAIVIYEDEIQTVDPCEAESGDAAVWKLALWGTYRDTKAVAQFKHLFPHSLKALAKERGWKIEEGLDLRNVIEERQKGEDAEEIQYLKELEKLRLLNADLMSGKFFMTVPSEALVPISKNDRYVRVRSGKAGLTVATAPHIFWSVSSAAYSDVDFVLRNPQVGISAPPSDSDYLRALSAFLNSSFGQYLLFFEAASWGVDRSKFAKNEAMPVHVPSLSIEQVRELASVHRQLADLHAPEPQRSFLDESDDGKKALSPEVKTRLTNEVARILRIPEHLRVLAKDFTDVRYQLLKGKTTGTAAKPTSIKNLSDYAKHLTKALDAFAKKHHKVTVVKYVDFVHCTVQITRSQQPFKPVIQSGNNTEAALGKLWLEMGQGFSQWVYVQRSLRCFMGNKLHLLKSSRLIDWTETQAIMDADDIIAEVLTNSD
jgi:hypothetical protein